MRAVIVGCGRVGAHLAACLLRSGYEVSVVDENPAAFDRLGPDFPGRQVVGTGIDEDVLREAGADGADEVLAMTDRDATNYMIAQVARHLFGVERVAVRVNDPELEEVFREFGLTTVSLTGAAVAQVMGLWGKR